MNEKLTNTGLKFQPKKEKLITKNFVFSESILEKLSRLSKESGIPQSRIVRRILEAGLAGGEE